MKQHHPASKEAKSLLAVFIFASCAMLAASVLTGLISKDPINTVFLGMSAKRLILVSVCILLAGAFLTGGVAFYRQKWSLEGLLQRLNSKAGFFAKGAILVLVAWGWLSIFCPGYLFGKWEAYFVRFQPFFIALGTAFLAIFLVVRFLRSEVGFAAAWKKEEHLNARIINPLFLALAAIAILIAVTRQGLALDTPYWNVPGVPVTGLQFFVMVVAVFAVLLIASGLKILTSTRAQNVKKYLLPLLILVVAALVWGLTPLPKHYFWLQPDPLNLQPYPFSDARVHDLGALSIARGTGIYFHYYTDKPLYMVILFFLHLFAGSDYTLLSWLHVILFAFIPVILYVFSKRFFGELFGLLMASLMIVQQRNAIFLAGDISSVNVKLLMTEIGTLFFVILICYLTFRWMQTRKTWLALLTGAAIGAASLIRMNPLLLFPALGVLIIPVFAKRPAALFKNLAIFAVGFSLLMAPWVVTGVNPEGKSWMLIKVMDVLVNRYGIVLQPEAQATPEGNSGGVEPKTIPFTLQRVNWHMGSRLVVAAQAEGDGSIKKTVYLIASHFLHNLTTTFMALPDSLVYDDASHLAQREYWSDLSDWQGDLSSQQVVLIFVNLAIFSLGLGYSWSRYRWAGLVPLVVLLAYSLSLGMAMNSGGRYIVPINWITFFYFGLGVILLLRMAARALGYTVAGGVAVAEEEAISARSDRKAMGFSLAGVLVCASIIPVLNLGLPAWMPSDIQQSDIEKMNITPADQNRLVIGDLIYPYLDADGVFTFNIIDESGSPYFTVPSGEELFALVKHGDRVLVEFSGDGAEAQVEAVYAVEGISARLIWGRIP